MADKIIIKDLRARGIIGIHDWERTTIQAILINIEIFADLTRAVLSDEIDESVNYRTIAKNVLSIAETAQRFTVEALAGDIARSCLAERGVTGVRVRVEKPGAVRFSESVGVEIVRGDVS